jgi:hypothetical protein
MQEILQEKQLGPGPVKIQHLLGFEDLLKLNEIFKKAGLPEESLVGNAAEVSAENFCEIYFKDIKDGDSIGIV